MSLLIYFKEIILKFRSSDAHDKNVFDHYFFDLKYYLNKDASIQDLSNLLNISTQKLDQISIENYACSCELLINEYRYKQFLEELDSSINSNLSVESILKFSGFKDNIKFVDFIKSKQSINH
jgi:hypothetical protein